MKEIPMESPQNKFWESKTLSEMNSDEWESLCDGCGRCCVIRLECEDSGEVVETNAACELLNCSDCRCSDYPNRFAKVPDCTSITLELLADEAQRRHLPNSCAYRKLAEGRPLSAWHPLKSGNAMSVVVDGPSLAGQLISESEFDMDQFMDMVENTAAEEATIKPGSSDEVAN